MSSLSATMEGRTVDNPLNGLPREQIIPTLCRLIISNRSPRISLASGRKVRAACSFLVFNPDNISV
jgi:hypothetical protein